MKKAKKIISICVSLAILGLIYWRIDLRKMGQAFAACDPLLMALALAMVIATTFLTSWRLGILVPGGVISLGEAVRLTLSGAVLNMVLPSKMGDLAKSYFMAKRGHLPGSLALSLVICEKSCDLLALLLWCAFGLVLYPDKGALFVSMTVFVVIGTVLIGLLIGWPAFAQGFFRLAGRACPRKIRPKMDRMSTAWGQMHRFFWERKSRLAQVAAASVFIWFLHLVQIWLFILALRGTVPLLSSLALTPLAILVGLLPLTFAGIGTRDAALIFFYAPFFDHATGAALGLLCTLRYIMPALAGLPFFGRYLAAGDQSRRQPHPAP